MPCYIRSGPPRAQWGDAPGIAAVNSHAVGTSTLFAVLAAAVMREKSVKGKVLKSALMMRDFLETVLGKLPPGALTHVYMRDAQTGASLGIQVVRDGDLDMTNLHPSFFPNYMQVFWKAFIDLAMDRTIQTPLVSGGNVLIPRISQFVTALFFIRMPDLRTRHQRYFVKLGCLILQQLAHVAQRHLPSVCSEMKIRGLQSAAAASAIKFKDMDRNCTDSQLLSSSSSSSSVVSRLHYTIVLS